MRVVKSCLLELREYKAKRIICQINIESTAADGLDFDEPGNFHWFTKDHWRTFDDQLEQIFDGISDKECRNGKFEDKSFHLNEYVNVLVKKSSSSVRKLLECLGYLIPEKKIDVFALDFSIRREITMEETTPAKDIYSPSHNIDQNLEYFPLPISGTNTSIDSSNFMYVPSNSGKCDLGSDDPDRYSPKLPLSPNVSGIYKPGPIRNTCGSISNEKDIFTSSTEDELDSVETGSIKPKKRKPGSNNSLNEIKIQKEEKSQSNQSSNSDRKPLTGSIDETIKVGSSHDDNFNLMKEEKAIESKTKKELDIKCKSNTKSRREYTTSGTKDADGTKKELRRSNRSPVKPARYQVEDSEPTVKKITASKKLSKGLMRKYFGSDGESDDFVEKTPTKPAPITLSGSAHSSSSVKKRKRDGKNEIECQQEQQSMSKWLSKKKPEEVAKSAKKVSRSSKPKSKETKSAETKASSSLIKRIVYPTPEEIEENERREEAQMRVNENMKNILADLVQVPKKVEILSLDDMSANEILNTFTKYKSRLDDVFHKLRSKQKVTGYNGINHYSVIELIDTKKQLKMMHKLGEVYETDAEGTSLYSTLFANALMPEWLVHIFKDKYNFSHSEAVTRLEEQRQYMQYMDVEDQQ